MLWKKNLSDQDCHGSISMIRKIHSINLFARTILIMGMRRSGATRLTGMLEQAGQGGSSPASGCEDAAVLSSLR